MRSALVVIHLNAPDLVSIADDRLVSPGISYTTNNGHPYASKYVIVGISMSVRGLLLMVSDLSFGNTGNRGIMLFDALSLANDGYSGNTLIILLEQLRSANKGMYEGSSLSLQSEQSSVCSV
jgi:hypothetical protein